MSGFHDPLDDTFQPEPKARENALWYSRELDLDDDEQSPFSAIAIHEVNAWRAARGLPEIKSKGKKHSEKELTNIASNGSPQKSLLLPKIRNKKMHLTRKHTKHKKGLR